MAETDAKAAAVVDTNVLLNLAVPVVDDSSEAPSGEDPLKALLLSYDIHIPDRVLGEVADAAAGDDFLADAGELVLRAADNLTTHDVAEEAEESLDYGLDRCESEAIWLTNNHDMDFFVTDEFGSTNYLLVNLALDDKSKLFTTPHILCTLAANDIIHPGYVEDALAYYIETKSWSEEYVNRLRDGHI